MAQDKEVQAMLLAEQYAAADLRAVRSYERKEGQSILVDAVKRIRAGETPEQLMKSGVDERTVNLAMTIK